MRTQRVVWWITSLLGFPGMVLGFPLGCVFGLLSIVPVFALLLLALSSAYIALFFAPLIALSWLWLRLPLLRIPLALVGVPWAVIGYLFVFILPELDEDQSPKITKLLLTESWPYSLTYFLWDSGRPIANPKDADALTRILDRDTRTVAAWRQYVVNHAQQ